MKFCGRDCRRSEYCPHTTDGRANQILIGLDSRQVNLRVRDFMTTFPHLFVPRQPVTITFTTIAQDITALRPTASHQCTTMSDSESTAPLFAQHATTGGKSLASVERPRYKSWRKKYRKMRHKFDGVLEGNKKLFKEEQKLEGIAKRLRQELE